MIEAMKGHHELELKLAQRYLLARLIREVRHLRETVKRSGAFGSSVCPICFMSSPHGQDYHDHENRYMALMPEDSYNADGWPIAMHGEGRTGQRPKPDYAAAPADTAVRDAVPRIPREPTEAMMNAVRGWKILEEIKRNLWRAMYDAASLQDTQQEQHHGD